MNNQRLTTGRFLTGFWLALISLVIAIIGFVVYFMLQGRPDTTIKKKDTRKEYGIVDAPKPGSGAVFLIVCDSDPTKIIVLDNSGKWMNNVKAANVSMKLGQPTSLECIMWDGPFKPSNPSCLTWELLQLQSMSAVEFQKMTDGLQSDPLFIKKIQDKKPLVTTP